jgi:hypothetical protein
MLAFAVAASNTFQELGCGELNPASKPTGTGQLQRLLPDIQIRLIQLRARVNDPDPFDAGFLHALLE